MTATDRTQNPFSGASLERRPELRAAMDWVAASMADPQTRFVMARGTEHLVQEEAAESTIAFLSADHPLVTAAAPDQLLLLGWFKEHRCVLVRAPPQAEAPAGTRYQELRPLLTTLPADQAAVLACARALLIWHSRHAHCGVCGAPTALRSAGHARRCTNVRCDAEFFPRIDPAIIALVSDGPEVLLGRQASWPPGRYSALAGFVEVGESLEDAVVREVHEETGVRVNGVRYVTSQPWPFPSSLMVGFHAHAQRSPIQLDGELEDARWYHAEELAAAPAGMLPARHTIARRLIDTWYHSACGRPLGVGV